MLISRVLLLLNTAVLFVMAFPTSALTQQETVHDFFIADSDQQFFYTKLNCCGLVAAYVIAGELGRPVDLRTISKELPVTPTGTSMDALAKWFIQRDMTAEAIAVNGRDLREILRQNPQLGAIALLPPGHWVSVFSNGNAEWTAFDYPEWRKLDTVKFDAAFRNQALLVGAKPGALVLSSPARRVLRGLLGFGGLAALITIAVFIGLHEVSQRFRRGPFVLCRGQSRT